MSPYSHDIVIRPEEPADIAAIRHVNEAAFGRPDEAALVDALRQAQAVAGSLVAVHDGQIVGHILFSPVTIESEANVATAVALGPMAVLPGYQKKGVGSQLVQAGIEHCRQAGYELLIVLGHPWFYPRFGFTPSRPHGIRSQWDVPDEVFMVKELQAGALGRIRGTVCYRSEFRVN